MPLLNIADLVIASVCGLHGLHWNVDSDKFTDKIYTKKKKEQDINNAEQTG